MREPVLPLPFDLIEPSLGLLSELHLLMEMILFLILLKKVRL